jgi:hypothetical protein
MAKAARQAHVVGDRRWACAHQLEPRGVVGTCTCPRACWRVCEVGVRKQLHSVRKYQALPPYILLSARTPSLRTHRKKMPGPVRVVVRETTESIFVNFRNSDPEQTKLCTEMMGNAWNNLACRRAKAGRDQRLGRAFRHHAQPAGKSGEQCVRCIGRQTGIRAPNFEASARTHAPRCEDRLQDRPAPRDAPPLTTC